MQNFIFFFLSIFLIPPFSLFIYFWLCWISVALFRLSLVAVTRGHSLVLAYGLLTLVAPFTRPLAQAPSAQASGVAACGLSSCDLWALEHGLSGCGARAQFLRGMWDPSRPGIKPVFPALAGGLPSTVPPGKSLRLLKCEIS